MSKTILVWFRNDLRLADNPALHRAVDDAGAVVPVFVWAPDEEGDWAPGGAHRWWLHHSLQALDESLQDKGSRLILRAGESLGELRSVIRSVGADAVYWNKRYEPALFARDKEIAEAFREDGIDFAIFESRILHDPEAVQTTTGGPYHVYTPFWNKFTDVVDLPPPLGAPRMGSSTAPDEWPASADLGDLKLLPRDQDGVDWAEGFSEAWGAGTPGHAIGEAGARERLAFFLDTLAADYDADRNRPDLDGTSLMSPRLHHGEISPRQIWHATQDWIQNGAMREQAEAFLQEIVWREFSYHMLYHYPETPTKPLKEKFGPFNWKDQSEAALERWQNGQTGYPIVDAAMRQLYSIGWMHNRMRMTVGSFLTKDLLIPWQDGARWFWDCLVDGDLANNTMGWQWSAGCGADAQPFFRIFNPVSQGTKYDPNGDYVRRWVPELADLPTKHLHAPWDAPSDVLDEAGVTLGETYPEPIVDHKAARERALERYNKIK